MARRPNRPARRREAKVAFDAIMIEGALLQPELVGRIASSDPTPKLALEYGLDPGEKLRDVVQTKFAIAQPLYARFIRSDHGPAALKRFLAGFFALVFDFTDLTETAPVVLDERAFPIGHHALGGRAPIVFAPFELIDKGDQVFGDGKRQRSPAQLLQEYLNADDNALWGLVCDGRTLRLYRDNAALTRPAYIEADLAMLFDADAPRLADFSALWLLIHASRFGKPGAPVTDCALERWREEGREKGARARDELRNGVEKALALLGQGFLAHPANSKLREDLAKGELTRQAYLDGLLRLVYRLIFVFAAEDRDLLHLPQPSEPEAFDVWRRARDIYRRGYGLARLRELSSKRHTHDRNMDGWEGVKILFRELWQGQPKLALPALGGLFGPSQVRDFADCQIINQFFYGAIFHLAWLYTENHLERVNWRDMETEELGSVYESLLELTPSLTGLHGFEFIQAAGHERKTTASYYTPDSLVQALLDETLDPLIAERAQGKAGKDAIEALLSLRIIDPACGSGHFLLAAARRLAVRCAQFDKPGEAPSPADYRHWLREVARRSLFGVDKNPMAIELAKVALWIETVEPGKPLSFLDAHLRCGDSLLGVYDLKVLEIGIPDEAYKPLTGDEKNAASAWKKANARARKRDDRTLELAYSVAPDEIAVQASRIEAQDEDDLSSVTAKAHAFQELVGGASYWRVKTACDLYVAAFLLPKTAAPKPEAGEAGVTVPTTSAVQAKLAGRLEVGNLEAAAVYAARQAGAFHWPLEFPQVFFPAGGRAPGFDLALGNPPWERIKLQEQEFFAARDPEIASAPNQAERRRRIDTLAEAPEGSGRRLLYELFVVAKRIAEAASVFARVPGKAGGRYPLTGAGDVNTYALFAELFATIAARAGIIVPTGIATDATTAPFFASLVEKRRLGALIDFENREGLFRAIDSRMKFAVLAFTTNAETAHFSFFLTNTAQIADTERRFTLSPSEIATINPNTRTAPVFRSKADADLTKQIYARVPALVNDSKGKEGNLWGIKVHTRIWHMAEDAEWFRTGQQLNEDGFVRDGRDWILTNSSQRYVPLYEAKMINFYDHRAGSYKSRGNDRGYRVLPETTLAEHADQSFEVTPYYWIPEEEVLARLSSKGWTRQWLTGWKDITSATNERTMVAAVVPKSGVGHKMPLFFIDGGVRLSAIVLAVWSSLTFDYIVRQKVGGTSLTYFYLKQFPMLPPSSFTATDTSFIVPRVLELTYTSHSMRPFAEDLEYTGNAPFPWDDDRRALLRAELDAKIARLYGLTRDQLRYILDPTDIYGPTYPSETFRVLKKNEIAKYGEYRTARLVLNAWDRLDRGEL